jgi:hypothetical protein
MKLQKKCSIFATEANALKTAFKLIENYPYQNYNIFSGSLGTINIIQNTFQTNNIAISIINQVKKLKNQYKNV